MLALQTGQAATLEERNRMARDIHDTLAQGFTAVIIQLQAAEDAKSKGLENECEEHLQRARDLARYSLNEARRSVRALRPQALDDTTFWDALKRLIKNTTAGTRLRTKFRLSGEPRELPPAHQEHLLHIGQEALTNSLKYAHASCFTAQLSFSDHEVRLELEDDGCGFATGEYHDGSGLLGMRERVAKIGGVLEISSAPTGGTKIGVTSPLVPQGPH
jgi:signal transduction histidine kinase